MQKKLLKIKGDTRKNRKSRILSVAAMTDTSISNEKLPYIIGREKEKESSKPTKAE